MRSLCKHGKRGIAALLCAACLAPGGAHREQQHGVVGPGWWPPLETMARELDDRPEHERGPVHVVMRRAEVPSTGAMDMPWVAAESPTATISLPPLTMLASGTSTCERPGPK